MQTVAWRRAPKPLLGPSSLPEQSWHDQRVNQAWLGAGEGVQRSAGRAVQAAFLGLAARCSRLFRCFWSRGAAGEWWS